MTRGGKRTGAGRKPSLNKKQAYGTKLLPEKIKFLQGLNNAAKWIDEAITEKRERENR
jgi:hypothetical protein